MKIFGKKNKDFDDVIMLITIYVFGLAIIGMFLMFGYLGIATIHDAIFQEEKYKSEFLLLDDVQYMDDGNILYRFGDRVIKDYIIDDDFNVNEIYEIVYIQYKGSWLNKNNIWEYDEIRRPT